MYLPGLKIANIPKAVALLVGIVFFGVGLASLQMSMGAGGSMSTCVFMKDMQGSCPMSVGQHLTTWQQIFGSAPVVQVSEILVFLACLGFASWLLIRFAPPDLLLSKRMHRYREKIPEANLFNYLKIALSQGILQPTVYA